MSWSVCIHTCMCLDSSICNFPSMCASICEYIPLQLGIYILIACNFLLCNFPTVEEYIYICICACTYIYIYTYIHTYIYIYIYIHIHIYIQIYIYIHIYAYIYTYIYIYIYIHIYIHTYIYIHTHTHIYIHAHRMDKNIPRMQSLHDEGANSNYRNPEANFATPLHIVCQCGQVKLFEALLGMKADVNVKDQVCYVCICVYMCTYMCVYMYIYVLIRTSEVVWGFVGYEGSCECWGSGMICMYVCTYMCVYVYIYILIRTSTVVWGFFGYEGRCEC
jgi:hypothetical protein